MRLKLHHRHRWAVTPAQATRIQERLRGEVRLEPLPRPPRRIAGVDVGFEEGGAVTRAAVVVLERDELRPCSWAVARRPTRFPYVPGLLSFRELPAVIAAFRRLPAMPDLVLCDGQGIAHPRRFGLAAHLGVLLDLPCAGVAKTRLTGEHGPLRAARGARAELLAGDEVVGAALRTRRGVSPVYVSCGHRISLEDALAAVLACSQRYRLPETTRWAHRLASQPAAFARALDGQAVAS